MADIVVTDQNFDTVIAEHDKPVLVDFWAPWCGPCRVVGPIVEEIAKDMDGKAVIAKLNVDENPNTAQKYNVMSIPTLIIFKNGAVVKQFIGLQSKETLASELRKLTN